MIVVARSVVLKVGAPFSFFWGTFHRSILLFFVLFIIRAALGEAYNGDIAIAEALEVFGGGVDDLVSVSIGGCWECIIIYSVLFLFCTSKIT